MKIGNFKLSENLFYVDMQGCGRTLSRTHFDYFGELCVDLAQFVWWYESENFLLLVVSVGWWIEDGLPVLIFGRVVWVELISGYDNIILKL